MRQLADIQGYDQKTQQWEQRHQAYQHLHTYHFKRFKILISVLRVLRYIVTRMARPTATSAAATAIIKNTNTWPDGSFNRLENATSKRLTSLSINSIHIKMMIAFRRYSTPSTPMVNSAAESQT